MCGKQNLQTLLHLAYIILPFFVAQQTPTFGHCRSFSAIPGIHEDAYVNLGDINIGGYIMATYSGDKNSCSKIYRKGSISIELAEAVAYAVQLVNEDPKLLPNVTLGFVLLNDCSNTNIALAKALQFLPQTIFEPDNLGTCKCDSISGQVVNNKSSSSTHVMRHYDVIGVISSMLSTITVPVSQLFSTSKIPLLGCGATSDELSDKTRHPFFLRVTAPDMFQVKAMLEFIQGNGWTYVSVLHAYGSYGEKGYESIKRLAPRYNICIATYHKVNELSDFDYVVKDLLKYSTANVVILFIYLSEVRGLFKGINRHNARGKFIWIGGDGLGSSFRSDFKGYEDDIVGTFVFIYYKTFVPDLYDYIYKLRTDTTTNPWLKPVWENVAGCSFSQGTCGKYSSILDVPDFAFSKMSSLYMDAVMVFAHAATKLLSDRCPDRTRLNARACIKGDDLLEYMKKVYFRGYSDNIAFDENGDAKGKYEIQQIGMDYNNKYNKSAPSIYGVEPKTVALYNIKTGHITYTGEKIKWDHMTDKTHMISLHGNGPQIRRVPDSVCSRPCLPGEYLIQKELQCCWDCRKCRNNERLVKGNTNCEECEPFTWPDADKNFTLCRNITLTYPSVTDPISLILISLGALAIISALTVGISFVSLRKSRIIKASSRELSFLQIVAVSVGYTTVILLQLPPSDVFCAILYYMFCLSFASLYSPLLVKALRVYRIFLSSSKFDRNPRFVTCHSQIIFTMILIFIQLILCVITYTIYKPTAKKTQPVSTEQYVELSCDMTLTGLVSFLIYNLILVFLCSVLAFKTRKLPDNFNESWFIFMCVTTTMIIWLAFVPTYFTASREFVKTLLLSVALLLNHTVALVFLFIPKVYAAVYDPAGTKPAMKVNFSKDRVSILVNRVAPVDTQPSFKIQLPTIKASNFNNWAAAAPNEGDVSTPFGAY